MNADLYLKFGTPGMAVHYLLTWWEASVRNDERGEITEKTIIIAGFALITLAVLAVIGARLLETINASTPTRPPPPPPRKRRSDQRTCRAAQPPCGQGACDHATSVVTPRPRP